MANIFKPNADIDEIAKINEDRGTDVTLVFLMAQNCFLTKQVSRS